jgi:hypothetical protein
MLGRLSIRYRHAQIVQVAALGCIMAYMPTDPFTPSQRASMVRLCEYADWAARRDTVVLEAYWNGVRKFTIHKLTGISRATIDTIIRKAGNQ